MPRYTDNLKLALPRGSKYWNVDTWNRNMEILDNAHTEVQEASVVETFSASTTSYDNTFTPSIESTNVQDAIVEIKAKSNKVVYQSITSNTQIEVPTDAHAYYILTFGDNVPHVEFVKSDPTSAQVFLWINGMPDFKPNKTYEISFLKLACIWYERTPFDFEAYFEYYVENETIYVTKIKAQEWYETFENYDFTIPESALGYPVMID